MGEGGNIVIINGTPYDWVKSDEHSYQMKTWSFPDVIPAGQVRPVYVEWKEGILVDESNDGGEVHYSVQGTSSTFQVEARAPSGQYDLQVYYDGLSTANNPQGSIIKLGWKHDGDVVFILSGREGHFSSTNPPSDWMQQNLATLGARPLRHLCIPGSHDSGMSTVDGKTPLANANNVLTQSEPIATQLFLGARYFDTRPVIAGGAYKTGHYSDIDVLGWQGANGQSFAQIVAAVNAYTRDHHELVVLNLSHDRNTDAGRDFQAFTQAEWDALFEQLLALEHRFVAPDPENVDLTRLPLNDFIGRGAAAVVVVVQPDAPDIALGRYAREGFYFYRQFDAYNSYANKDHLEDMVADQLDKMRAVRGGAPDAQLFLLSWTLTQAAQDIVTDGRILSLAAKANPAIFRELPSAVDAKTYPNILYIDDFSHSDITALAMAINDIASYGEI
ncbi:PLC-like phosphodiesterase [Phanerochaete sordida]|uniref:PLC-like phosphodiesterase n=1 Tax=Phanerochaete sordida TaxID=48140 RepID=A0A9P3LC00_9APHY|nr:PLC-like phosphodiesterase [Phanerochaete sordida]